MHYGGVRGKKLLEFVGLYDAYPDELTADMFEVYGIDIRAMDLEYLDDTYGLGLVATLAVQLPWPSRIHIAADPRARWGVDGLLLARIDYMLQMFAYSFTDDAKNGVNAPRLMIPETEEMKRTRRDIKVNGGTYTRAQIDYDTYMKIIRENVEGGMSENGG